MLAYSPRISHKKSVVVHGLHTPRDSEEAQPCTAKELQEVIRQLPADPRQWNYTYSIELSEYRELIRLFQQVEPGDILDELWNQLRFDYDSTTQQFTIMSAGALHAYITQHLNTQILHYIEACRKSGGLIQALAMMLGCSGDFPYDFSVKADPTTETPNPSQQSDIEKHFVPDSAWRMRSNNGGGLVIEVARTQTDKSLDNKIESLIKNCNVRSVIVIRNSAYNNMGACIELWRQTPDGEHVMAYQKDYLNSDGDPEAMNADVTADVYLTDFLSSTFLLPFDPSDVQTINDYPPLRLSLHDLAKVELESRGGFFEESALQQEAMRIREGLNRKRSIEDDDDDETERGGKKKRVES